MAGGSVTERSRARRGRAGGGWPGVVAGLGILALLAWLAFVNIWMFVFVVGILVSVFLHETGHFVTARLTGMKATQFFIGFGPRLWSFQRGETEYGVRALPLGAFVRIIGMNNLDEVPPEDEARTYRQQTLPAPHARHLGRLDDAHADRHRAALRRLRLQRRARASARRRGQALSAGGPAAERRPRSRATSILRIDGVAVDDADDLGEAVRAHEPGDTSPSWSSATAPSRTFDVDARRQLRPPSDPNYGSALLGVELDGVDEWQEMSLGAAAASSVTDLFPTAWETTKGVVKVLNPVNIVNHLTRRERRPRDPPDHARRRHPGQRHDRRHRGARRGPATSSPRSTSSSACSTCSRCCRSTAATRRSPPTSASASAAAGTGATSPTCRS